MEHGDQFNTLHLFVFQFTPSNIYRKFTICILNQLSQHNMAHYYDATTIVMYIRSITFTAMLFVYLLYRTQNKVVSYFILPYLIFY